LSGRAGHGAAVALIDNLRRNPAWRVLDPPGPGLMDEVRGVGPPSGSLSIGSANSVPGTGELNVGAWKPSSMSRLAISSAVPPVVSFSGGRSRMHSWATRPLALA